MNSEQLTTNECGGRSERISKRLQGQAMREIGDAPIEKSPDGERILKRLAALRGKLDCIQDMCMTVNRQVQAIKVMSLEGVDKAEHAPRDTVDLVSRLDAEIDALFAQAEGIFDLCSETNILLAQVVGS